MVLRPASLARFRQRTAVLSARRRWLTTLAIAIVVFGLCSSLYMLNVFESLELKSCYFRFKLRGEEEMHPHVGLVVISDSDVEMADEPLPWPREYFAVMIQTLAHYGAKVIALDLMFGQEKDKEGDEALAQSIIRHPNCVTAFYFDMGQPVPDTYVLAEEPLKQLAIRPVAEHDADLFEGTGARWPIARLRRPGQVGFINVPLEEDGTVLRLPLVMRYRGYVFPSLTLAMACDYLGVEIQKIEVIPGRHIALTPPWGGPIQIPIDSRGRMVVNFKAGAATLAKRAISFMMALRAEMQRQSGETPEMDLTQVKGKAIVIAGFLTAGKDLCTTPLGTSPGAGVHVNALSNILDKEFIRRHGRLSTVLVLAVCSMMLAVCCAQRSVWLSSIASASIFVGYFVYAWLMFVRSLVWVEVVAPAANMIAFYVVIISYRYLTEEREKGRIRALFTRYLSPDAVDELLQTPEDLILDGEIKEVSVLVSDIRDFTPITEEIGARETVALLNEYFDRMVSIVHKYEGAVDKFVGDEILAVWGAPKGKPTDAINAVRAAVEMRQEMAALTTSRAERGLKTFAIGIGLNTGEAMVGNIGTAEHMDYTAIGDTINYAARLESLTKEHRSPDCPIPILMSQTTYERVKGSVDATPIGEVQVKGKRQVSMVYKLNALR